MNQCIHATWVFGVKSAQHIHKSFGEPLHGPFALWVVGAGISPCNSSQLAQLLDHCTLKISALICMESCWKPKSTIGIFPQHLCHSDSHLVFCGVSLGESQKIDWLPLGHSLSSLRLFQHKKIYAEQFHRGISVNAYQWSPISSCGSLSQATSFTLLTP